MEHYFPTLPKFDAESTKTLLADTTLQGKQKLIQEYMRLAINISTRVCKRQKDKSEFISEGMVFLTQMIMRLDPTKLDENFDLRLAICFALPKHLHKFYHRNHLLRMDPRTKKKLKEKGIEPKTMITTLSGGNLIGVDCFPEIEIKEILDLAIESDIEREVIMARIAGSSDVEIATEKYVTRQYIGQVRTKVANRIEQWMKKNGETSMMSTRRTLQRRVIS